MTLPIHQRLALWEASDRRCRWCRRPIFYGAFEEDHIIPRHIESNPVELERIKQARNLGKDYDLNALENIVAACRPCNGGKGWKMAPDDNAISLMLHETRQLAPAVRQLTKIYATAAEIDKAVAVLQGSFIDDPIIKQHAEGMLHAVEVLRSRSVPALGQALVGQDWVTYTAFPGTNAPPSHRRVWLVQPPGHVRVAVVLESSNEPGTFIQNAAETIAAEIDYKWQECFTVLHYYGEKPGSPWENFWWPVLRDDEGLYEAGVSWDDPRAAPVKAALIAAGLTVD
jgi:hypothetical protein